MTFEEVRFKHLLVRRTGVRFSEARTSSGLRFVELDVIHAGFAS